MSEIRWTNVRGPNSRVYRAEDGRSEIRRVRIRLLWTQRGLTMTAVFQADRTVEVWRQDYSATHLTFALRAYDEARIRGERWLRGTGLVRLRRYRWLRWPK